MPVVAILTIIFQVVLSVHVVKRGNSLYWIILIILFPLIGGIVYLVVAVIPEMRNSSGARHARTKISKTLTPNRDLRDYENNLEMSDTIDNKINLANELLNKGMVSDAIELYTASLTGIYEYEPILMLGLSRAYFENQEYKKSKNMLELLIKENPDYKSQDGHLLYARSLEMLDEFDEALEEYKVVSEYYSGYEAKCRYALLLKSQGKETEANQLFHDILKDSGFSSKHANRLNSEWIKIAKREVV